jgi:hypothetical protein
MNWSVDRAVIHRRERLRREKDEDTFHRSRCFSGARTWSGDFQQGLIVGRYDNKV